MRLYSRISVPVDVKRKDLVGIGGDQVNDTLDRLDRGLFVRLERVLAVVNALELHLFAHYLFLLLRILVLIRIENDRNRLRARNCRRGGFLCGLRWLLLRFRCEVGGGGRLVGRGGSCTGAGGGGSFNFWAHQERAEGGHPGGAERGHRRCLAVEAGLALCPWKMNLPK